MMAPVVGRIQGRSSFRALARPDGRASRGPVSVAFHSPSEIGGPPLPTAGYAIGRRHGNAVRRNRLRRRLRAAMTAAAPSLPPGIYLVRADTAASELGFDALRAALCSAARAAADAGGRAKEIPRGH
jgi:ribonuclease P protein component